MPYKDPDKRRAKAQEYSRAHYLKILDDPEKIAKRYASARQWYHDNKEQRSAHNKQWHKDNRERKSHNSKRARQKNPALYRAIRKRGVKTFAARHPERYRAMRNAAWNRARKKNPLPYRANSKRSMARFALRHPETYKRQRAETARRRRSRKQHAAIVDFTAQQWKTMTIYCDHRCVYCDRQMQRLEQDHLTPLTKGGNHTLWNILPACRSCNAKKRTGPVLCPVQPFLLI